jgi:hypothetical protein
MVVVVLRWLIKDTVLLVRHIQLACMYVGEQNKLLGFHCIK